MAEKHKHYDLIVAWAGGAKIQCRAPEEGKKHNEWVDLAEGETPVWLVFLDYRIKPEPKPDRIEIRKLSYNPEAPHLEIYTESWKLEWYVGTLKFVFDGETSLLKSVEVIK